MGKGIGKLIENEEGATSVLVIFMMIVLVTLGAFAITSSNVNYKFGQKSLDWNKMYYLLESQAEQYVMDVDLALSDAETKAVEYILGGGYEKEVYEGVSGELQQEIVSAWKESANKEKVIYFAMQQLYMSFANENLQALSNVYPENVMTAFDGGAGTGTEISFTSEDNNVIRLKVGLEMKPISDFQVTYSANKVILDMANASPRYQVVQWYQWQETVETEIQHEVWDGGSNPDVKKGEGIFDQPNTPQDVAPVEDEEIMIIE